MWHCASGFHRPWSYIYIFIYEIWDGETRDRKISFPPEVEQTRRYYPLLLLMMMTIWEIVNADCKSKLTVQIHVQNFTITLIFKSQPFFIEMDSGFWDTHQYRLINSIHVSDSAKEMKLQNVNCLEYVHKGSSTLQFLIRLIGIVLPTPRSEINL